MPMLGEVIFESGSMLRTIGEKAFSTFWMLTAFTVPSSVEIIGDRSFDDCIHLSTATFEETPKLKRISLWAALNHNSSVN
jgi:hypothetical protein